MAVEEGGCQGDRLHPHPLPEAPRGQEAQDRHAPDRRPWKGHPHPRALVLTCSDLCRPTLPQGPVRDTAVAHSKGVPRRHTRAHQLRAREPLKEKLCRGPEDEGSAPQGDPDPSLSCPRGLL